MYDKLSKSFYALESDFYNWRRLATTPKNPFKKDDFITAAFVAGKLCAIANILHCDFNEPDFKKSAWESEFWIFDNKEKFYY